MGRVVNFSAGPAALPEPVLARAQAELLDWRGRGLSVMEMSHRGEAFRQIAAEAEADLRQLLGVPDDYAVLFLQGGATLAFAGVPLNLADPGDAADYVLTGAWSKKALGEAERYVEARVAATSEAGGFTSIPPQSAWETASDAAYVHVTLNETIGGVEFHEVPCVDPAPLVADVSSTILSRPLDVTRFGCLYAGAQKNVGPAGVTLVVTRRDLLGRARAETPSTIDWTKQAQAGSMLNTPPCWAWYVCGLVFRHLLDQGGLAAVAEVNERKAGRLYDFLDGSTLFRNPVVPEARSRMNVPFLLRKTGLEATLLREAEAAGLNGLKGHRSVGGLRASLYNAVSEADVEILVAFLRAFGEKHG